MTTCPDCDGEGERFGFGCPGFRPMTIACPRCQGTGLVEEKMLLWMITGAIMKQFRLDANIGLRKAANLLNMKPSSYSVYERGIKNPERIYKCLQLKLKKRSSLTS